VSRPDPARARRPARLEKALPIREAGRQRDLDLGDQLGDPDGDLDQTEAQGVETGRHARVMMSALVRASSATHVMQFIEAKKISGCAGTPALAKGEPRVDEDLSSPYQIRSDL